MKFTLDRTTETKKFNKHYNFSVGSCHAATALRHDYVKMLKKMKEDIDIKYVRFHGVFCDDMHTMDSMSDVLDIFPNGENYVEENFYLVGIAYDNLLECGVKPFVELSFMPELLAKDPKKSKGFYGANMSEPKDYEAWGRYIHNFITFLIHRYGVEEVRTWYFEVWNEPDLYGAFFNGDKDAYFKLYKVTAKAIKSVDHELRVGGPSTSACRWVKSFVEYCKDENIPLDFVSTHQYPGDPFTGISADEQEDVVKDPNEKVNKLKGLMDKFENSLDKDATPLSIIRTMFQDPTETKDIPDNIFRKNAEAIKEVVNGLPVYFTEWNLSAVFSAYSNDTKKAASYITKTVLDIEPYVTGSSLWCFSDIFEEMHQFKEEFHGGFGLQTIHGIPKPSYYAMKFLTQLPEERYILEDGLNDREIGIAAFKEYDCDHLMLFRHSMKTADKKTELLEVSIPSEVTPKEIVVRRIDDSHCNPLTNWEKRGQPKYLKTKEVDEIIAQTSDIEEPLSFELIDGMVNFNVSMELNDVYYIQIKW